MPHQLKKLYRLAARASLVTAALFLFGLSGLFSTQTGNWLVLLFKLLAGIVDVQPGMLYMLNGMDILLLALLGVVMAGLCAVLWQTSRVWSLVAAVQPPAGIILFLATQSAGRSAFMGSVLVISLVMLPSKDFKWWTAWSGILAGILLLAGDLSAAQAPLPVLAAFFAAGYCLMVFWLISIGISLNTLKEIPIHES